MRSFYLENSEPRSSQLSRWVLDIAGHNKERPTAKGLVLGPETFRVVVLLKVHDFLAVRHYIDGHAVVAARCALAEDS